MPGNGKHRKGKQHWVLIFRESKTMRKLRLNYQMWFKALTLLKIVETRTYLSVTLPQNLLVQRSVKKVGWGLEYELGDPSPPSPPPPPPKNDGVWRVL